MNKTFFREIETKNGKYILASEGYLKNIEKTPLFLLYRGAIFAQLANCGYIICHEKMNTNFGVYEPISNEYELEAVYEALQK